MPVEGACDARFAGVREAMRQNMAKHGELGAAVAVLVEGRAVVDLWCGWSDQARSRRWERNTVVNAFSVGKALAGLCVLMLVSRSKVDFDEPVARCWPEFAAAGKEEITVRQVLSHSAGLAAIERELPDGALYDWDAVTRALAEQRPWWTPGGGHGYHVHTFGFLVGEIVRRVTGESIATFLQREVAQPLGAEIGFGLAPAKRALRAEYVFDPTPLAEGRAATVNTRRESSPPRASVDSHLYERAYLNPPGAMGIGTVNTKAWQTAVLPSANLHADARGVAQIYGALAKTLSDSRSTHNRNRQARSGADHGPPIVDCEVLREATTEATSGVDLVLGRPSRFGLGFQLTQPERPLGPNEGSFGHFGAGGSVGFADPQADVAFGYVMNRGGPQWQDPRNRALIDATYEALGST